MLATIYVKLLDEATECWRPVHAEALGGGRYKIADTVPEDEAWQFNPGDIVLCRKQTLVEGARTSVTEIVAYERAS